MLLSVQCESKTAQIQLVRLSIAQIRSPGVCKVKGKVKGVSGTQGISRNLIYNKRCA